MPKKKKKISDFNGFDFDLIALFDDGASFFSVSIFMSNLVLFLVCVRACVHERMFLCPQMMLETKWIGTETKNNNNNKKLVSIPK